MNCNAKGIRGQIEVLSDLYKKGFSVFLPFDDYSPVDVIALRNDGKTFRLQIKYRHKIAAIKTNRYELQASSVVNRKRCKIDKNLIDGWAMYCVDDNKVCYVSHDDMGDSFNMSIDPTLDFNFIEK